MLTLYTYILAIETPNIEQFVKVAALLLFFEKGDTLVAALHLPPGPGLDPITVVRADLDFDLAARLETPRFKSVGGVRLTSIRRTFA